jgi:LuxR family maltose regulon positive regulatory protein
VGLTVRSDSTDGVAPAVRRGIVSRRELFERLGEAGRVVHLSAPAGSGKRILLRSWIAETGLADSAAWVAVGPEWRDPQRFWISVTDAIRGTREGSKLVKALTAAPDLDGWAIVERLLTDLGRLEDRIWLVIDDLHELRTDDALRQLELLVMRAPAKLRFVLATRHDLRLGLHRLRLEGELTEIRAADLRFTLADSRTLFEAAGVHLSDSALQMLLERTEGWVAGLRLAALSLRGHPDPERFAAEFSGTERTVADYLLAEVLERQAEEVRQLLLRTSVLERVSGPLADVLTGGSGGERILNELEEANAFVVSLDARRSWFRYHPLFADLLQLELRRSEPGGLRGLHVAAAEWLAEHGYSVEAIRHFQAAESWNQAAHLLFDNSLRLQLNGQRATARELLARFPAGVTAGDPELAALSASDAILHGSAEDAESKLAFAARGMASVAPERRVRFEVSLTILRLILATRIGNLPAIVEEAQRILSPTEGAHTSQIEADDDLRAVALTSLGIAELWLNQVEEAERHLEQGVMLAHDSKRPFLETNALAHWAMAGRIRSLALAIERGMQAVQLARRHGWPDDRIVYPAYVALANSFVGQGRLEEAEQWLEQAERLRRPGGEPTLGMTLYIARGLLEGARGRNDEALAAFRAAQGQAESVVTTHTLKTHVRALVMQTLIRMGETESVEKTLSGIDEQKRMRGDNQTVIAHLRLAQGDPQAATIALAPVIDGSAIATNRFWVLDALVLDSIARDASGDDEGAHRSLERALDVVEPDGAVIAFLLNPAPRLLERHSRRRTSHAALVAEILNVLAGNRPASTRGDVDRLHEPLSDSEKRILRYLPTNLSVPEIAGQTYLSVNTVKTHMRHLYGKLGAHSRGKAVERARGFGLLAPSALRTASHT